MSQIPPDETQSVSLELPARVVAQLQEKAALAGKTIDVYLTQLAELNPPPPQGQRRSLFDLIGAAPTLRSGEDIAQQLQEERDAWGEP